MKTLLSLTVLALLAGCGNTPKAYIEADRATYDAVAPAHRAYLEADESLTPTSLALRLAALDSWKTRLRAAEEAAQEDE